MWTIEDGILIITLTKVRVGEVWTRLFDKGSDLSPTQIDEIRKQLLLERFGRENPDFDFSSAQFNGGTVPDPRTFLSGPSLS
jgi:hypothetical protein